MGGCLRSRLSRVQLARWVQTALCAGTTGGCGLAARLAAKWAVKAPPAWVLEGGGLGSVQSSMPPGQCRKDWFVRTRHFSVDAPFQGFGLFPWHLPFIVDTQQCKGAFSIVRQAASGPSRQTR